MASRSVRAGLAGTRSQTSAISRNSALRCGHSASSASRRASSAYFLPIRLQPPTTAFAARRNVSRGRSSGSSMRSVASCSSISRSMPSKPTRITFAQSRTEWFSATPHPNTHPACSARMTSSGFSGEWFVVTKSCVCSRRDRMNSRSVSGSVVLASSCSRCENPPARKCGCISGKSMFPSIPGSSPKWWSPTMSSSSRTVAGTSSTVRASPAARRCMSGAPACSTPARQNASNRQPVGVRGPSSIRALSRSMRSSA